MGSLITTPALELVGNHEFVDASAWTLYDYTNIAGGLLHIQGIMLTKGGAWQVIDTKVNQIYRFIIKITFKGGDPWEHVRLHFGTGGARVSSVWMFGPAIITWIVADPDGTGLLSLETEPNADDNHQDFEYISCKLYSDLVAENLGIADLENTFSDSWLLAGNKIMIRLVNERNSINNLYIVDI